METKPAKNRAILNEQKASQPSSPPPPALVKVRVGVQGIFEAEHHSPGSEFETTEERAAALGDLITRI